MDKSVLDIDWSLMQAFLAVAEAGSLSGAARVLGVSQPTLGRQIREVEERTGLALFKRQPRGLDLTGDGAALLPYARAMRAAMRDVALYAAGHDAGMAGVVRIAASEMVAHHILPPIIADVRAERPEIEIELVPSDRAENLLFREADIAVRMYRPDQLDVVARRLGELEIGIFAARSYLERRGRPDTPEALLRHDLVGYDRSELILRGMAAAGFDLTRGMFATRCDNQVTYWELLRAGCGIGFGQRHIGQADPAVEEIDIGIAIPGLPVWLAAHRQLRQVPRLRHVWDRLAAGLAPMLI
ncbi:LysR family transcriptional regulator [Aquicoccus porphyridii]|uniref:LysR family transcriptional regulator n=1 Tax=Aquicoccus porphyridii TaxID=1852029 RepID=UPI00273D0197|nr:LysR family transcriptional regulator [Aquicoccus porphyridii]